MAARDLKRKLELLALSPDRAISMLSQSAESGNADAAYMLAMIYESGAGVARDLAASTQWLHRAAELDYPRVVEQLSRRCDDLLQHMLGYCDALLKDRPEVERRNGADEIRRTVEALADSTHDLEMVAARGCAHEQRDTA